MPQNGCTPKLQEESPLEDLPRQEVFPRYKTVVVLLKERYRTKPQATSLGALTFQHGSPEHYLCAGNVLQGNL